MFTTCLHPVTIRNKSNGELMRVPCGKCEACRSLRALSWTQRLEQECSYHKYTMFVTLTYSNECLPIYDVDQATYRQFDLASQGVYEIYLGVPYVDVHDMQLFFKNLRNLIKKHKIDEKIRYYYLAELGSTTKRPHIHVLVWFSDDALYANFESFVRASWVTYFQNKYSYQRGNIDCKPVGVSVCRYVASYVTSNSCLPNCFALTGKVQFHQESRCPPIGLRSQFDKTYKQSLHGLSYEKSVYDPRTSTFSDVPLWKADSNYLFPKCYKFSALPDSGKYRMYLLSKSLHFDTSKGFQGFFDACRTLCQAYIKKYELYQYHSYQSNSTIEQFLLDYFTTPNDKTYIWETNRLRSAYYISTHVLAIARQFGIPSSRYISYLLEYYQRADYAALKKQLEYEQQLSKQGSCALRYYPLVIDPSIISNDRKLDDSYRDSLLASFGYTDFATEYPLFISENSSDYKLAQETYKKIYNDSIKSKVKNDYIKSHPEFKKLYV